MTSYENRSKLQRGWLASKEACPQSIFEQRSAHLQQKLEKSSS